MTQSHSSTPAGDLVARAGHPLAAGDGLAARFVTLSLEPGAVGAAPPDVVLARAGAPLRPDALVVAREPAGYAVRRVARVTADGVALVGDDRVPRDPGAVVGTVLLRWHVDDAA